ncbi:DEAD/DEAH box helicase family protein [Sorangium sp. So ce385]|uniref:DEAD/DEAH box helicase family protein n=1 Tax=Sorangium sp. So ce385 TaxID=3133308 RepID=UPI003F5B01FC
MTSPFLEAPESAWVASNALAFALRDRFPVSPGHTLVIPRRLVPTWFDATAEERAAIFELVDTVKRHLDAELHPDGYNVGINAGEAAGQTVMHLHVHVIPRFCGDVDDPRGGVRHVIPGRGNYLAGRPPPLATGGPEDPFLRHLAPVFARATDVAILSAFVQESGLDVLESHVFAALARGARVRLVTGDYLHFTQATALAELLDWAGGNAALSGAGGARGSFEARVVEVDALPGTIRSFHPKSWRFEGPGFGAAFVGSSNISRAALGPGIEWNLRVDRHRDPDAYRAAVSAFERWWCRARPLTADWVERYAQRATQAAVGLPPGEEDAEPLEPPPPPHPIQREALAALHRSRAEEGRRRALVVLATGLGKTYLAALDVEAWSERHGRRPRVLVLAHREELLVQAARTFRRLLRGRAARFGWCAGSAGELAGDVVFASVQKLSRPEHLARLAPGSFDYAIVDEVHHGTAPSYRAVLDRLDPGFLLGLTATPERADGADVAGLFDDHVAYRADIGAGIARNLLVPFAYFGLRDETDYRAVTFHNRRFDPGELEKAIDTDRRLEQMWRAWQEHPGERTLVFCCSIRHAHHACDFFAARGVRVAAVHSGPESAPREEALADLVAGKLDALCAVDLFNEGIDLPSVDRVVMLRPTESPVVFLQQLGRGLRVADGKARLTVLDFVGNHRVFLDRVRTLVSLGSEPSDVRDFLGGVRAARLPPGCAVDLDLEAKELLLSLLPARGKSEVERAYRDLRDARGERPTAGALFRMGYRPATLRPAHQGWFDFVASEGDLSPPELRVLRAAGAWLRELEITAMSKCYKMVTLEALLEAGALFEGISIAELARRSRAILARSPELSRDLDGAAELGRGRGFDDPRFVSYWKNNPIAAWTGARGRRWFALDEDRFVSKLSCPPGDEEAFAAMTRELVDYRLAMYRARRREDGAGASFSARVLWNKRDPILKLPSRAARPDRPSGDVDVRLPDGEVWRFRFMKELCNVAHRVGSQRNELPDLLRRWFGLAAGRPGTAFHVRFVRSPDGLWAEPESPEGASTAPRSALVAFPDLRAAAGAAAAPTELSPEAEAVRLPIAAARGEGLFAVRAAGDSMDGGKRPIRDGDWLIMKFARGASYDALEGKVALLQIPDRDLGVAYQIKRLVRDRSRWWLRSDNPDAPSYEATAETVPVAILVEVVRPEDIGPSPGERFEDDDAAARAFGLEEPPRTGRVGGHLFFCLEAPGALVAPDRIRSPLPAQERRPGETAFVLVRPPGEPTWRTLGVARYLDDEGLWACPGIDHAAYRALGSGRGASRSLPAGSHERARALVEELLRRPGAGAFVERDGRHCRIVGRADGGGLRVDGGPGGFAERTVSLTDLAWVIVARDDVGKNGGRLDEQRVNRLRYLEGTPRAATRWIDTGWALALAAAAHPAGEG